MNLDDLPKVRGSYRFNAALAPVTWFHVGGPADVLFKPQDSEDLCAFLSQLEATIPVIPLGVGSNVLVRDGGIRGVVIRLGRAFTTIIPGAGSTLMVGAGALDRHVAEVAAAHGIDGLAFLSGIPGTIGGALRMNAGAYGREMRDCVISAQAVDRTGALHTLSLAELDYSYRHCGAPGDLIFVSALLQGAPADPQAIFAQIEAIQTQRAATQPIKSRTGGSTFANPPDHKAWALLDAAGYRGRHVGGAAFSELHCNFLLNTGDATATDLETLGENARAAVLAATGIDLRWEIQRLGETACDQD